MLDLVYVHVQLYVLPHANMVESVHIQEYASVLSVGQDPAVPFVSIHPLLFICVAVALD